MRLYKTRHGRGDIVSWTYYPEADLLAYRFCSWAGAHSQIQEDVESEFGETEDTIASGRVMFEFRDGSLKVGGVGVGGRRDNLSEDVRSKMFSALREMIKTERLKPYEESFLGFVQDQRREGDPLSVFFRDIPELADLVSGED